MKGLCISILAGGQSSRMGQDKGLTEWAGKCLIQHIIDAARPLSNHIHIIANDAAYARLGWPVISDQYPGTGPAGGIATALLHSPFETNLILSCDIPRIDTGTLQFIVASHKPGISVPVVSGQWQPLVAVYDHSIYHGWMMLLQKGERALHQMIRQLPHQEVDMRSYPHYHEMAFQNMNTPEELRQAGA